MSVILINPFEIAPELEDEALAYWERCASVLRQQPGFLCTRLHRALTPDARFRLVNVAEWESVVHFQAAVGSEAFRAVAAEGVQKYPHFPALYEVVRT